MPHPGGNQLFEAILAAICVENHVRLVDFISYSIWHNMLGILMGWTCLLQKKLFVPLRTVNIMQTQNRSLKICIYWKLPIYLMSSVWNFGTSSQIIQFQTIFDLCSNTIAVYMILKPGTTVECMFFQPERLVHVTSCDIASQNEYINFRQIW